MFKDLLFASECRFYNRKEYIFLMLFYIFIELELTFNIGFFKMLFYIFIELELTLAKYYTFTDKNKQD